jgi:hypothetical protein
MSEFGYYRGKDIPEDLRRKAQEQATREISDFTVSLIQDQRLCGSATLVSAHGAYYLLTAHHVAKEVCGKSEKPLGINIDPNPHQFFIEQSMLQHIEVGKPPTENSPDGPDISAIRILDPDKLTRIGSKKSFYRLDGKSSDTYNEKYDMDSWWIAGAPFEFTYGEGEPGTGHYVLGVTHFHAEATFMSVASRDGFDFLSLSAYAGSHQFPANYQGVSGGGIWFAPQTIDPDVGMSSLSYASPFLAGVAYYQQPTESDQMLIFGHGPESIYQRVYQALAQ